MLPVIAIVTLLSSGDAAFNHRKSDASALVALDKYRESYHAEPENPETAWRVAMACYFVGLRLTSNEDRRKELYDEGRKAGLTGAERKKDCAPCHFWGAINLALYGDAVGALKMLFALGEIRDHLKRSIEIDPGYAYGGAYRVLGRIEQKLPGILGGSNDRARDYFQKAIEVAPEEPMNYLYLTRLLNKGLGDKEGAALVLNKGRALSSLPPERVESNEALEELKALKLED